LFEVQRPDNLLPESSLVEVEKAIAELQEGRPQKPRIIVKEKPGPTDPREATAFIEGKEDLTKMIGRSKYDAVGQVVVLHPESLGVEVVVEEQSTSPTLRQ
jgi:hypothetical protein